MSVRLLAVLAACALIAGCYESRVGSGPAGDGGARDALRPEPPDAEPPPPRPPDSGPMPPPSDAGPALDADTPPVPIPEVDAGADACEDGERVPDYDGPGCEDSTVGCLMRCTDNECVDGCLESDPECEQCINRSLVHCANERSCQKQWDEYACCREMSCDGLGTSDCASGPCREEMSAWRECYLDRVDVCGTEVNECFF